MSLIIACCFTNRYECVCERERERERKKERKRETEREREWVALSKQDLEWIV